MRRKRKKREGVMMMMTVTLTDLTCSYWPVKSKK